MSVGNLPFAVLSLPLAALLSAAVVRWVVWTGLVLLTVAVLVLMRTGWGQSQPLRKCIVLSLLVHLMIGIYTTTINIVSASIGPGNGQSFNVSILDGTPDGTSDSGSIDGSESKSWEAPGDAAPGPIDLAAPPPIGLQSEEKIERSAPAVAPPAQQVVLAPAIEPEIPSLADKSTSKAAAKTAERIEVPPAKATPADPPPAAATVETPRAAVSQTEVARTVPAAPTVTPADPIPPAKSTPGTADPAGGLSTAATSGQTGGTTAKPAPPVPAPSGSTANSTTSGTPGGTTAGTVNGVGDMPRLTPVGTGTGSGTGAGRDVPGPYRDRVAADRGRRAEAHGGNAATEAAVSAALKWLADNQTAEGRWRASNHGAGREVMVDGQDRRGAGAKADVGISSLALLAFLASGDTHLRGPHAVTVRRGLEYLLRMQGANGSIFGEATQYEQMYCHAMATFALGEAYAMTGDQRLQPALRRAVGYCVSAQDAASGGWRYEPGQSGDTSQLGWQVMALKSAELGGLKMPEETRQGMIRFLKSVASGKSGGLASYRPGQRESRAMTAEALVCRQFLGMSRDNPAGAEAGDYLLTEVPGHGTTNLYYWYYATLGMYQLQGPRWERWNEALQSNLLGTQRSDGAFKGSWDPDPLWGAYGGRVYSTALSALCLEVYYRFLPLYVEAAGRPAATK